MGIAPNSPRSPLLSSCVTAGTVVMLTLVGYRGKRQEVVEAVPGKRVSGCVNVMLQPACILVLSSVVAQLHVATWLLEVSAMLQPVACGPLPAQIMAKLLFFGPLQQMRSSDGCVRAVSQLARRSLSPSYHGSISATRDTALCPSQQVSAWCPSHIPPP